MVQGALSRAAVAAEDPAKPPGWGPLPPGPPLCCPRPSPGAASQLRAACPWPRSGAPGPHLPPRSLTAAGGEEGPSRQTGGGAALTPLAEQPSSAQGRVGGGDGRHPEQKASQPKREAAALYLLPVRCPGSSQVGPIFRHTEGLGATHAGEGTGGQVDAHGHLVGTHGRMPRPPRWPAAPSPAWAASLKASQACLGETACEEWAGSKRAGRGSLGLWQTLPETGKQPSPGSSNHVFEGLVGRGLE